MGGQFGGEGIYMFMCGWILSLFTWNHHNIVKWLYPNTNLKKNFFFKRRDSVVRPLWPPLVRLVAQSLALRGAAKPPSLLSLATSGKPYEMSREGTPFWTKSEGSSFLCIQSFECVLWFRHGSRTKQRIPNSKQQQQQKRQISNILSMSESD